jgi:hypothetical protein
MVRAHIAFTPRYICKREQARDVNLIRFIAHCAPNNNKPINQSIDKIIFGSKSYIFFKHIYKAFQI